MTTQDITKEATDRFAKIEGVSLHYNDVGSGPALLCFHGGGPGANGWDNSRFNVPELSKHFRMLIVDLPGYGESDKDADLPAGEKTDTYSARLIKGLLDDLGIKQANFYNSSFSGPFALRFALDYPERTGKVILQASTAATGGKLMFQSSPAEGIKALTEFRQDPTRERMQRMIDLFVPDPALRTDELVDRRFKSATTPGHLEAAQRWSGADKQSNILADIHGLQADVLVVWGQQDWMVPVEGAIVALAQIPRARLHIWGDTGHFVQYEKTDEFNRLVIDFLTH